MSKAITKNILVIVILLTGVRMNAQQWLGRTTGNYSGTYGLYNNASSIADSKYKYYFNIWGRGVNFYNNNMLYNAPIKINQWANGTYDLSYQRLDGKPDFQKDWLVEQMNGKTKQFSFNQDIWGPSFMFPLSKKVNMSINTRQRNSLQVFGISEPFARMAYNGVDSNSNIYKGANGLGIGNTYSNGKFGINAQSYQELSFSFAGVLAKNEHHQLTGGATVKFIRGLGAAYARGSGFDMAITGNNSAALSNADLHYAYTDDKSVIAPFNNPYGLFSLQSKGGGAGIDLGITYTYTAEKGKYASNRYCNENNKKSDYDIKIAAAFNDIGGIRYNQSAFKYGYSNNGTANINAPSNILNGFHQPKENAFDSIGKIVFDQLGSTRSSGFNTSLPTAFNLQADFRFTKHFYTSLYLNQSLKSINSAGMRSTSMLSIIPRVESRGVEFSMPLTLADNYKSFNVGAYLRIGPVFFGSDNLGGLLNVASNNQFSGADIYGGVSFGIGHCARYRSDSKVESNHLDTVTQKDTLIKKDTLKTEKRDTIKIIKHDTIKIKVHDTIIINKKGTEPKTKIIHDTLYIEKTIKSKADIDKENELKNRESIIILRQKELDQREKDLKEKEKGTYDENEALKKCKDQTSTLLTENVTLRNKVVDQDAEIVRLKKQVDDLNKIKVLNDAEIVKTKTDKAKAENDAVIARRKSDSLQTKLTTVTFDLTNCKKNSSVENNAEIVKAKNDKAKAENDATIARRKADSLQAKLTAITVDLDNCRKNNGTDNNAEIVKAKNDKAKAENDAIVARRKADSLQAKLTTITVDLTDCRKNNGTDNNAEIVKAKNDKAKAENDAIIARRKADSLQAKLDGLTTDLTDCKKSNVQNEANIVKLKKAEDDKALYKSELDAMVKTNQTLNAKLYKREATIDSLISELSNCGNKTNTDNNAELLKKCNEAKADMAAEIIRLKDKVSASQKSLDSITDITANLRRDKALADAQIAELNTKIKSNNCDELTKELEEKNKTISDLKTQNTTLQAKVTSLTNELNGLKIEYQFVTTQNQKCSKKLDSCMRGLLEHKDSLPDDNKDPNKGGPFEGNNDSNSDDVYVPTTIPRTEKNIGAGIGWQIIKAIVNSSSSSSSSPSTGSNGSSTPSGKTNSGTSTRNNEPGSNNSGSTQTNSGRNTTSTNTNSSTRRR